MLRFGILASLLLGSAFYFPIPGSDPCRALTTQYTSYLYNLDVLSGFEQLPLNAMADSIAGEIDKQFTVYPTRWGCAIEYWRNEADTNRIDRQARADFKKVLMLKITMETGHEPYISNETLDELFLE